MILFSTIVVYIAGMWTYQARASKKSRNRMVAAYLGEMKSEEFLSKGYAGALSSIAAEPTKIDLEVVSRGTSVKTPFEYYVLIKECPDLDKKHLVGVLSVTVYFPDETQGSVFQKVTYETYLSKPTPIARGLAPNPHQGGGGH